MSQVFSARITPDDGAMFAPGAFERAVGTEVDLKVGRRVAGKARIRDVEVAADGLSAVVIFETQAVLRLGEAAWH